MVKQGLYHELVMNQVNNGKARAISRTRHEPGK